MRLKTIFKLGLAAIALPSLCVSAFQAWQAWNAWALAGQSTRSVVAMGWLMAASEKLAVQRGLLVAAALGQADPTADFERAAAAEHAAVAQAAVSLQEAGENAEPLKLAEANMTALRRLVLDAVRRPLAERDAGLPAKIIVDVTAATAGVNALVDAIGQRVQVQSAPVAAVADVAVDVVALREAAGRRSTKLSPWVDGKSLSAAELDAVVSDSGRVEQGWDQIRRRVATSAASSALIAALRQIDQQFFQVAEPQYRVFAVAARNKQASPMSFDAFRTWTVAALASFAPLRDALIVEAKMRGDALTHVALLHLLGAVGYSLAVLLLGAAGLILILQHVVRPIGTLTNGISRLSEGDLTAQTHARGRVTEIEMLRGAVVKLSDHLAHGEVLAGQIRSAHEARLTQAQALATLSEAFQVSA